MANFFKYNKEAQTKYTPNHFEPFLKNVPKEKLFTLPTDKSSDNNKIRILPPWSPEGMFAKVTTLHYNVGINKHTFVCPNLFEEGSCPFCAVIAKLRGEYEKYKVDINEAGGKLRAYSNIVDVNKPNLGCLVFSYGSKLYFPIKKLQDSGEYGDITDIEEGRDISISRTVSGKNMFQDTVLPSGKPTLLMNADALDELFNLDSILPEIDIDRINVSFKSHPWKVYSPSVSKSVPANFESKPQEDLPKDDKSSTNETPSQSSEDRQSKISDLEKKLREKRLKSGN